MRQLSISRFAVWAVLLAAGFTLGCGGGATSPELADVVGTVLINGAPPPSALRVVYEPQSNGSKDSGGTSSEGTTDPSGKFELKYRGEESGAVPGSHVVRIYANTGGGPAGGEMAVPLDMVIPPSYNDQSTITRSVEKGKMNEHTIEIEMKKK